MGTLAVGLTPRACPGVAVGAPVDVYLPLPEVSGLLRAGSRPSPRSSLSRGSSRSSTSPPPSFHLSRNGAARVHGGFVLRLRFSPGAGRCPVSPARPPLAWSSLAGFADSWLRPEGQGASRFPDVAPRCCVLGGGPLRPAPAGVRFRAAVSWALALCRVGSVSASRRLDAGVAGLRRVAYPGLAPAVPRLPVPVVVVGVGSEWCYRSFPPAWFDCLAGVALLFPPTPTPTHHPVLRARCGRRSGSPDAEGFGICAGDGGESG